jgi:hypothetical protein
MSVTEAASGIVEGSTRVFPTNAAVWRFVDRQNGEPISGSEASGEGIPGLGGPA